MSKFENVSCSQCGQDFGPGNHGFSHCEHHRSKPGASAPQEFGSTIDRTLPAGILPQQADAPPEQHPLRCDDGGQCGVGGYCGDCPAISEQGEQQGDGGADAWELNGADVQPLYKEQTPARDYLDTLTAVLNAIGYTEEFAAAHPDLKVSEGVKLFLALQRGAIECQAHIGSDCTECGGTGFWENEQPSARVALSGDTARLDWLIEHQAWIQWKMRDGSILQCQVWDQDPDEEYHILSGDDRYFDTPRDAIDAAIAAASSAQTGESKP